MHELKKNETPTANKLALVRVCATMAIEGKVMTQAYKPHAYFHLRYGEPITRPFKHDYFYNVREISVICIVYTLQMYLDESREEK